MYRRALGDNGIAVTEEGGEERVQGKHSSSLMREAFETPPRLTPGSTWEIVVVDRDAVAADGQIAG